MIDKSSIAPHAEILGSCGHPLGKVDGIEGDFLKLTRKDSVDGKHHYLPLSAVADVKEGKVITIMNHVAAQSLLQDNAEPGEGGNFVTGS